MTIITSSQKLKDILADIMEAKATQVSYPINDSNFAELKEVLQFAISEAEGREEQGRQHDLEEQAEELRQKEADEEEDNKMRNDMVNDERPEEE